MSGAVINVIVISVVVLAILFLIFLIMREFMCWYWKINQLVSLLTSIDNKLSTNNIISTVTADSVKLKKCSKCGKEYLSGFAGGFCEECGTPL
jgi:hypothetical protein